MQYDRRYWQQHVLAHRHSRLTQSAYCRQHGLHPKTYRTWSRRLEAEGGLEPSSTASAGAKVMEGVEELAYPLHGVILARKASQAEFASTVTQRQRYTGRGETTIRAGGAEGGAHRWAVVASSTETAKHSGIEPYGWLRDKLTVMVEGHPTGRLDDLLPWPCETSYS